MGGGGNQVRVRGRRRHDAKRGYRRGMDGAAPGLILRIVERTQLPIIGCSEKTPINSVNTVLLQRWVARTAQAGMKPRTPSRRVGGRTFFVEAGPTLYILFRGFPPPRRHFGCTSQPSWS